MWFAPRRRRAAAPADTPVGEEPWHTSTVEAGDRTRSKHARNAGRIASLSITPPRSGPVSLSGPNNAVRTDGRTQEVPVHACFPREADRQLRDPDDRRDDPRYILASATLNPAARFLGRNPAVPQGTIDASLQKLGADPNVPLLVRTWNWWVNLLTHGSLGISSRGTEVTADIFARAGTSLRLLVIGTLLGALLGVLLGVWNAVRQYKASDQVSTYLSFAVLATPPFVIAVVLMILATTTNNAVGTQVISFTGEYTPGVTGFFPVLGDRLVHLLLPTISLTVGAVASYSRYQRSAMLDVLSSDYIRTARPRVGRGHPPSCDTGSAWRSSRCRPSSPTRSASS